MTRTEFLANFSPGFQSWHNKTRSALLAGTKFAPARFGAAAHRFARSGFAATPPEILAQREATCRACDQWDAAALNATGRCRKCGCSTWAKLRMATERCPLGKWEAVTAASEVLTGARE